MEPVSLKSATSRGVSAFSRVAFSFEFLAAKITHLLYIHTSCRLAINLKTFVMNVSSKWKGVSNTFSHYFSSNS